MLTMGCSRLLTTHDRAAIAEDPSTKPAPVSKRQAVASALVTTAFPFDAKLAVNSQNELAVDTSGSHNLRRRSNR